MRSPKLTYAIAATAAMLALSPAAASAAGRHPHLNASRHSGAGGCRIDVFSEPSTITSGEAVQVFGMLRCQPGTNAEGQTVTVFARPRKAGKSAFQTLGTTTTGAGGSYSIIDSNVTSDTVFYASALGARSANKQTRVAPQVTLAAVGHAADSQLRTGVRNRVVFSGAVSPADAGAQLVLQRENAVSTEEWHAIQFGVVGEGGTYSLVHTFRIPGDANIRVLVRRGGKFSVRGISESLSFEISQAENPLLTINALPDPISSGQSVTISGTLKGASKKQVTLLSRPHGPLSPFTKVAEMTTNDNGEYSFVEEPHQNTIYHVTGEGVTSAALFEGVKYVLVASVKYPPTANVTAKATPAGQPLIFSGTVTPDHPGHVVYLERENAFGGGFHVADVGTVTETSTYSITHYLFGNGKQVYRVRVPGDPENQAVSSELFDEEVTPAPLGSLQPVPASRQPDEGQL